MNGTIHQIECAKIVENEFNVKRTFGSPCDLMLVESVSHRGILQPLGVWQIDNVFKLGWGWRRLQAAIACKHKLVPAMILTKPESDEELHTLPLIENLTQSHIGDQELMLSMESFFASFPQRTQKDLAKLAFLDPSEVSKLSAISRVPTVREAFLAKLIPTSAAYCAAKAESPELQERLLNLALGKAPRSVIERAARQAEQRGPKVQSGKARIVLPGNLSISISGKALTMDSLIDILGQAMEATKRAAKEGLDIRTMQAVLRAKAQKEATK